MTYYFKEGKIYSENEIARTFLNWKEFNPGEATDFDMFLDDECYEKVDKKHSANIGELKYYSLESGYLEVFTIDDLRNEYIELFGEGYIEDDVSFSDWLSNATDKNGTLERIKRLPEIEQDEFAYDLAADVLREMVRNAYTLLDNGLIDTQDVTITYCGNSIQIPMCAIVCNSLSDIADDFED